MSRLTEEEVLAAIAAKIDGDGDDVVDYNAKGAAYWTLAVLSDMGLLRNEKIRSPWILA